MKKNPNLLYVLHSGTTGGTFNTNLDLMKNMKEKFNIYLLGAENNVLILYHYYNDDLKVLSEFKRNQKWSAKTFHDSWLVYIYYEILLTYDIDLIHIRHLINHSFDLPQIANKLHIPIILSLHDFYFICPNFFLLNENLEYCKGICSENDENCKLFWGIFDDIHFKTIIPVWREQVEKMFNYIDIFISTSEIVKNLFLSIYTNKKIINEDNFIIIEHGRDFVDIPKNLYEIPSIDAPLKIVFPANNLNEMKGMDVIKNIKRLDDSNELEFHFLGNVPQEMDNYGINQGYYPRDEFYKTIEKIKPSFIGIFSIWPETYCHTITEAWSCGIPVIGTNIGVIENRILKNKGGFIIDKDDPKNSYDKIINLKKLSKQQYLDLIEDVSKINIDSTRTMADRYLEIYNKLLKIS